MSHSSFYRALSSFVWCDCFTQQPVLKLKGKPWLSFHRHTHTILHHITSTAFQYIKGLRSEHCSLVYIFLNEGVATCLACMNHSDSVVFLLFHTETQKLLGVWRPRAAEFYGGIEVFIPSLSFPVGTHPSSWSGSASFSHAGTIKVLPLLSVV